MNICGETNMYERTRTQSTHSCHLKLIFARAVYVRLCVRYMANVYTFYFIMYFAVLSICVLTNSHRRTAACFRFQRFFFFSFPPHTLTLRTLFPSVYIVYFPLLLGAAAFVCECFVMCSFFHFQSSPILHAC